MLHSADVDHEELIEVGAEDREETETGEERRRRIFREREHPHVELERGQETVDELVRRGMGRVEGLRGKHRHPQLAQREPAGLVGGAAIGRGITDDRRGRPLRHELRAGRDRQGRQRHRVPEHRGAHPRDDVLGGEPSEAARGHGREVAPQAPHQPHFDRGAAVGRRDDAEQPHLAFHVPEYAPQRPAAGVFAASLFKRQAQRGTAAAQRQAPVRDREHGGLPGDGGGRCTHGGALQPIGRRAGHAVPLLDRPCESCRRDHAPRAAPCGELVELTRASPRAPSRGDGVVRQHELRHRNDGEAHGTQPPLDLELDLQHETAGIDQRAEAARRLRVAAEDVTRLELGHARLAPCYTRDL